MSVSAATVEFLRARARPRRHLRIALSALFIGLLPALALPAASGGATATTYTVNSTADASDANLDDGICDDGTGACTLRAAIEQSNETTSADANTIQFAFPSELSSPYVITIAGNLPEGNLPPITHPVTIDATTVPDFLGKPLVELRGNGQFLNAGTGLEIEAGGSTVCGLAIDGFFAALDMHGGGGNRIEGNYLGLDTSGLNGFGHAQWGIIINTSGDNVIGVGANEQCHAGPKRNVIARNDRNIGLVNIGDLTGGNRIAGNYIGTDASGMVGVPGQGLVALEGILIESSGNTIGGPTEAERNVISGNGEGININRGSGNAVLGNFIGTDKNGEAPIPNSGDGILVGGLDTTIGGSEGTTPDGACTGACNLVSGNTAAGIVVESLVGEPSRTHIEGNFIGTDRTGTSSLRNGFNGISIGTSGLVVVGGETAAARNLISGNGGTGITIYSDATGNRIRGNYVGTDTTGSLPIGNLDSGIVVSGGDNAVEGNLIAFNRVHGVVLGGTGSPLPGNPIRGNSIHTNDGLAIDNVGGCFSCADPNDPGDPDLNSNDRQNYPVIESVSVAGTTTTVRYSLNSRPNADYELDFFRNAECDPVYYFGEAETALGTKAVTTGGDGNVAGSITFPVALGADEAVTATATNSTGGTSEVSQCRADVSITKTDSPDPVRLGETLTYTLTVHNGGPAPATGVEVTDQLPASETLEAAPTPSQGSCSVAVFPANLVTCKLGEIGRDEEATITIAVKVTDPSVTTVTNSAKADWAAMRIPGPSCLDPDLLKVCFDPDLSNNVASEDTTIAETPGAIVVKKQTLPDGDPATFTFTGTAAGTIGNGGEIRVADLAPGTYTSTETVPSGWDVDSIICDDGDSTGDRASAKATFRLAAGETVTCTFTDAKRGTIVVKKRTDPVGTPGTFSFSGDVSGSIGGGGQLAATSLPTTNSASYSASEADPAPGFDLVEISCDDGTSNRPSSGDLTSRSATFRPDPGETVTCTFVNRARGRIIVKKQTLPSGSQESFSFTASYDPIGFSLKDGQSNTSGFLPPASGYNISEAVPSGWAQTGATCDDGSPVMNIDVGAGETITCTFVNTQRATLIVRKQTLPAGATRSFDFRAGGLSPGSFTLTDGGSRTFADVVPGSGYSLAETVPPGWQLKSASCSDGSPVGNIDLGPGETVTCTFTDAVVFVPSAGAFVIGDKNAAIGTAATFWGAQWWKLNTLTGGTAPAAFKGFAKNPSTPSCGAVWDTGPGNSPPPPPPPLPSYMGVIVADSIGKSGSSITGNTAHIVIVRTNGDYAANPGHDGTGTVVGTVC